MIQNKLGITNSAELAVEEERISKQKALRLFESNISYQYKAGSFDLLCRIHAELFGDIYDFAGKLRTVNISKGGFRFAPVIYLAEAVRRIEDMPQNSFDEIIEKYVEMNVAHPFREGNGRSMRIWLDDMLRRCIGKVIDWSNTDKNDYLLAMERSPVKDTEIKLLLRAALTDNTADRELFMKGIDKSYEYEGYSHYTTAVIDNMDK